MKIIITENQLDKIINRSILEEGKKPSSEIDITKFQNFARSKGFKNVTGPKKGQLISADGDWGKNSEAAWQKYGSQYGSKGTSGSKLEYPFDVLSRGASAKEIANIIKKSNGGWFRNDYEDWAEAAFNAIKNKSIYQQVTNLLGKDVLKYIKDYMNTSKVYYNGPSIDDSYAKLIGKVRVGTSDDLKKPKTFDEITKFQNFAKSKGFKNVTGPKKGQLISADGNWGKNSEAAWQKYGSSYDPSKVKVEEKWTGGYVIPFAFPEYQPSCDGTSAWDELVCGAIRTVTSPFSGKEGHYGKLGHAGVATVTKSGGVQMFEFGRYPGANKGGGLVKSKNLGNIAKIVDGEISNLDSVIDKIHRNTQGQGPSERIEYALLKAPNIEAGIAYAKSITKKDYAAFDFSLSNDASNCATYALEVVKASGINLPDITGPTPVGMIEKMQDIQLSQENKWAYYLKKSANAAVKSNPLVFMADLFI